MNQPFRRLAFHALAVTTLALCASVVRAESSRSADSVLCAAGSTGRSGSQPLAPALGPYGTVAGTVTDRDTGAPLAGVTVTVGEIVGDYVEVDSTKTDASGHYSIDEPAGFALLISTSNGGGYINRIYNDIVLRRFQDGTKFTLQAGVVTQIDFRLERGSLLRGTVSDYRTGAPIAGATVVIRDATGDLVRAVSAADGTWASSGGVPTGTYYAVASAAGYNPRGYADVSCVGGCANSDLTPIAVTQPVARGGINLLLRPNPQVGGTVLEKGTGLPPVGDYVYLAPVAGGPNYAKLVQAGQYVITAPPGSYRVIATGDYYYDETYPGITCGYRCTAEGSIITLVEGDPIRTIDLSVMRKGGSLRGTVYGPDGKPVAGCSVAVASGGSTSTGPDGTYEIRRIPPGPAAVSAWPPAGSGLLPEYSDGSYTNPSKEIFVDGAVLERDFHLDLSGHIAVTVLDEVTETAIPGATVSLFDGTGKQLIEGPANGAGVLIPPATLVLYPGPYFAQAQAAGYRGELADDVPLCSAPCPVAGAKSFNVVSGVVTNATVRLKKNAKIGGRVTDAETGLPLANVSVSGNWMSTTTDSNGIWSLSNIPYDKIDLRFSVSYFDPVEIPSVTTVPGTENLSIDVAMRSVGVVNVTAVDAGTGTPISDAVLYLYDSAGRRSNYGDSPNMPGGTASYTTPVTSYLAVTATGYVPVLYDSSRSRFFYPTMDVKTGTAVTIVSGHTTQITLRLKRAGTLTAHLVDADTGQPVENINVEVYSEDGQTENPSWGSGGWYPQGNFTLDTLPPGKHYLKAGNSNWAWQWYDGVMCAPSCSVASATPVVISSGTTSITFKLKQSVITDVQPRTAAVAGGTRMYISGAGLVWGMHVFFDGVEGTMVQATPLLLTVDAPPHPAGTVDVTIVTPGHTFRAPVLITYGSPCEPPALSSSPTSQTVTIGQQVTLNASVTGSAPLSLQWFQGESGDTTAPVPGATATSLQVTVSASTSYWLRASNACGSVSSGAWHISAVSSCAPPAILFEPGDLSVLAGQAFTLSISAGGSAPLSYQWYEGASGDRAKPLAVRTPYMTVASPTATTDYWLLVTNSCGSAQTRTIHVAVTQQCAPPQIVSRTPDPTVAAGTDVTLALTLAGTAPLDVQWYEGLPPDMSRKLGATGPSITLSAVKGDRSLWAIVTNSCGTAVSEPIHVTVEQRRRAVRR